MNYRGRTEFHFISCLAVNIKPVICYVTCLWSLREIRGGGELEAEWGRR